MLGPLGFVKTVMPMIGTDRDGVAISAGSCSHLIVCAAVLLCSRLAAPRQILTDLQSEPGQPSPQPSLKEHPLVWHLDSSLAQEAAYQLSILAPAEKVHAI